MKQKNIEKLIYQKIDDRLKNNSNNLKDIEYYSQSVHAWYLSSLEMDKSILTFSMAGLGFLITLITTGFIDRLCSFIFFIIAAVSFLITVVMVIWIFSLNKAYLECVIHERDCSYLGLGTKDTIAVVSFLLGVVFSIVLALLVAIPKINI